MRHGGGGWLGPSEVQKGRDRQHKQKNVLILQGFIWAQRKERSGKHKGGQVGIRKSQVRVRKSQVSIRKSQAHKGRDLQHKKKYHSPYLRSKLVLPFIGDGAVLCCMEPRMTKRPGHVCSEVGAAAENAEHNLWAPKLLPTTFSRCTCCMYDINARL